jgi:hypothetical protein
VEESKSETNRYKAAEEKEKIAALSPAVKEIEHLLQQSCLNITSGALAKQAEMLALGRFSWLSRNSKIRASIGVLL